MTKISNCNISQGDVGAPGKTGEDGTPGKAGEAGPRGQKGERGKRGMKGHHGEIGPQGAKGEVGEKGDKGDKGTIGPNGVKGEPVSVNEFLNWRAMLISVFSMTHIISTLKYQSVCRNILLSDKTTRHIL